MNELCLEEISDVGYAPTSSTPTQKTYLILVYIPNQRIYTRLIFHQDTIQSFTFQETIL